MSYQLTGKIKLINDVKQVSETFKVREIVVTIDADGQYPQHISIQATNDKCDVLSTYAIGSDVTVHFNLRGREGKPDAQGNVRFWNSLDMWKIENATATTAPQEGGGAAPAVPANQQPVAFDPNAQGGDDLPF